MRRHVWSLSLIACAVLALSACKPQPPAPGTPPPQGAAPAGAPPAPGMAPPSNGADDNLNAVLWMQRSEEFKAVSSEVYRAATDKLDEALKQSDWNALTPEDRSDSDKPLKPAVIMDVDETVLDNSPYQARLVKNGKEYDSVSWDQWVAEKKAKPLPGVVDFAKAADAKGITVLYVTNRAVHLDAATLANLRGAGMPVADNSVLLGLGTVVKGCEQNGSEKSCRRKLVGQQYRVLMQFGDQLGDFVQVIANTPDGRAQLYQKYQGWFGSRWWMLPNPSYGSWQSAQFNNDYTQPRDVRRQAERAALETAQ